MTTIVTPPKMLHSGQPVMVKVEERRSISALIRQIADDATLLARTEVKLARAEITDNLHALIRPAIMVGAAALLGLAALFTLMGAFVGFLTPYVGAGWAALIVAGAVGLIAFLLLQSGLKGLSASALAPKRAVASVKADVAVVKESVK